MIHLNLFKPISSIPRFYDQRKRYKNIYHLSIYRSTRTVIGVYLLLTFLADVSRCSSPMNYSPNLLVIEIVACRFLGHYVDVPVF